MVDEKFYVVVSNNRRNRSLPSTLAVRVTSTVKPPMPSIVVLPHGEVVSGRVLCDDIVEVWDEDVRRDVGALSPQVMREVDRGLAVALGLRV
jgi:mRNA interferase MazF